MFTRRILTALSTALALIVGVFALGHGLGLWPELARRWAASRPPAPYRFASLKNLSAEEMFRFMSGAERVDSFHEKDAPDSNFPARLWNADPKTAALDFVEANRSPKHRENYHVWLDSGTSATPPDSGWLVLDTFGTQTVLRFGVEQPFLFHAATSSLGWSRHPYVDSESHSLQLVPLSPDEARFLAHTVFWLEKIQSRVVNKMYMTSKIHVDCGGGFGILEWNTDKAPPENIEAELNGLRISDAWRGEYDKEARIALIDHLLAEALPEHLGNRWEKPAAISRDTYNLPLAERLKSPEDPASHAKLTQRTLAALASHEKDPWPATALVPVIECAGEAGLIATLPALETLNSKQAQPSADEEEFTRLDARFHNTYSEPKDPGDRKDWERHQTLEKALKRDLPAQVRQPLLRSIRQLHALGDIAQLRELEQSDDRAAMWALQQLYRLQPDAYAEALIRRFPTEDDRWRATIFSTLAELNPSAARRLRDSLDAKAETGILFSITDFERTDDPARARSRIPALLDIAESAAVKRPDDEIHPVVSKRGPAIEMLAKLPLDSAQRQRFERVLLNELLNSRHGDDFSNGTALREAAEVIVTLPEPDRFWDALHVTASVQNGYEFNSLLESLANLAVAKPEPRLSQLTELLRQRLRSHNFSIDDLCMAALALDLRELSPEIEFYATSGPELPDGENTSSCTNHPDTPCPHRYHSARHVIALWSEPDADTRARMWAALFHHQCYEFHGNDTLSNQLRHRFEESLNAASPELRIRLISQARSSDDLPKELSIWLETLR